MLEGSRGIGQAEVHDQKVEGAEASVKSGFPFVTGCNANEVVSTAKVNLGEDLRIPKAVKQIWNEREWIMILSSDGIETTPINTKVKRTILFLDKKDRSTTCGLRRSNEVTSEVLL